MRKIQLYKKGFNVKNAVFDLKLALSQFRKNDIPSYLNSALHIYLFSKAFLMVSKLPSVSPKMDEEKKFLALVDDINLCKAEFKYEGLSFFLN